MRQVTVCVHTAKQRVQSNCFYTRSSYTSIVLTSGGGIDLVTLHPHHSHYRCSLCVKTNQAHSSTIVLLYLLYNCYCKNDIVGSRNLCLWGSGWPVEKGVTAGFLSWGSVIPERQVVPEWAGSLHWHIPPPSFPEPLMGVSKMGVNR